MHFHILLILLSTPEPYDLGQSKIIEMQGRAVGVAAGATRAFGRRTQGVWGRAPQPPEASSAVIKL